MQQFDWQNETFILSAQRVMYWPKTRTLIASDLHFGKTGHFRKHGIAVPQSIYKEDLHRLFDAIGFFNPERLLIVGDFMHSQANQELELVGKWRNDMPGLNIVLIKGNHDILSAQWYIDHNIEVKPFLLEQDLLFVHDLADGNIQDRPVKATVSGHLHPAVLIKAGARQQLRLPCFYFNAEACILPAFSVFSGTCAVKPQKTDTIFAILPSPDGHLGAPTLLKL